MITHIRMMILGAGTVCGCFLLIFLPYQFYMGVIAGWPVWFLAWCCAVWIVVDNIRDIAGVSGSGEDALWKGLKDFVDEQRDVMNGKFSAGQFKRDPCGSDWEFLAEFIDEIAKRRG